MSKLILLIWVLNCVLMNIDEEKNLFTDWIMLSIFLKEYREMTQIFYWIFSLKLENFWLFMSLGTYNINNFQKFHRTFNFYPSFSLYSFSFPLKVVKLNYKNMICNDNNFLYFRCSLLNFHCLPHSSTYINIVKKSQSGWENARFFRIHSNTERH